MRSILEGSHLCLRPLSIQNATTDYLSWLNDPITNRFLESRHQSHTQQSLEAFIDACNADPDVHLFGIFSSDTDRHVGNIKLGPVDRHHRLADIGILLGDPQCRGKGFGTEAIQLVSHYAFDTLDLHKVTASMYDENQASFKAFLKAGFELEGRLKKHLWLEDHFTDKLLMGLVRSLPE